MALTYNGISFTYPRVEVHSMGSSLDPSNSDQTFTTIHLKAKGIINLALSPAIPADGDAGATLARIRHLLTTPRCPLYYDLTSPPGAAGPNPVLNIPTGRDDANGPFPDPMGALDVTYTTPSTLEVAWGVTVRLRDCDGQGSAAPLSLRWEDTIQFDNTWKATYRRTGTLIVSSLDPRAIDVYRRNNLAPAVPPGFARESASYTISRDGLRCDFVFVDGQIRYAPPYPCIDLDIVQQENSPNLGGMRKGEIHVRVRGVVNANPADMYYWAVAAGMTRLFASYPLGAATGKIPGSTVFRLNERKDAVEADFSISYKVPPTAAVAALGRLAGLGPRARVTPLPWLGFATTPASPFNLYSGPGPAAGYAPFADPTSPLSPGPADGKMLAPAVSLFAALLRDPCGSAGVKPQVYT